MNEKLCDALSHIRDAYIAEAAGAKKKRRPLWLGAVAAVLVLVICFNLGSIPMAISAKAVSTPSSPRVTSRPHSDDYHDPDAWRAALDEWSAQRDTRYATVEGAAETLSDFFAASSLAFLSEADSANRVWSPVNGCIALAMLAETTGGESRQQILNLLGAGSMDALREQVSAIWETVYQDDGKEISTLANSLWLDGSINYNQEVMDNLSYYHYASVYQGNFGTQKTDRALQAWLNNNTGGLLKDFTGGITLPPAPETVLALVSTVHFQSKWSKEFSANQNTQGTFHAPGGDIPCTFMNKKEYQTDYYWGSSFGAVSLGLKNGSSMWLILPDEGKTIEDVLSSGEYLEMVTNAGDYGTDNSKYMKVNLSLPKFDVSSSADLAPVLQKLGITDVFDTEKADFSPSIAASFPVFLSSVNQAARVTVDESGVKAASYIELPGAGAAAPPEEIIDFVLDRPFLFVISSSGLLPLFMGVVNTP